MTVAERALAGLPLDDDGETPPVDRTAEKTLVGLASLPVYRERVLPLLDPADFMDGRWKHALVLLKAGRPLPDEYRDPWTSWYLFSDCYAEPIETTLQRVRECAEARRLISVAQQIAERAWRVPDRPFTVADAKRLLDGLGAREVVRVEVD